MFSIFLLHNAVLVQTTIILLFCASVHSLTTRRTSPTFRFLLSSENNISINNGRPEWALPSHPVKLDTIHRPCRQKRCRYGTCPAARSTFLSLLSFQERHNKNKTCAHGTHTQQCVVCGVISLKYLPRPVQMSSSNILHLFSVHMFLFLGFFK